MGQGSLRSSEAKVEVTAALAATMAVATYIYVELSD
jgi:hypothetical protein